MPRQILIKSAARVTIALLATAAHPLFLLYIKIGPTY
jgi:hypothetical protein